MQSDGYESVTKSNNYETDLMNTWTTADGGTTEVPPWYDDNIAGPIMYIVVVILFYTLAIVLLVVKSIQEDQADWDQSRQYKDFLKKHDYVFNVRKENETAKHHVKNIIMDNKGRFQVIKNFNTGRQKHPSNFRNTLQEVWTACIA